MRALYFSLFGIIIVALNACNDSSNGNDGNAEAVKLDTVVSEDRTSGGQQVRGSLGQLVDYADAGVHGKVVLIETIYTNDRHRIPHQLVNIKVTETIFGDVEHHGTDIVSIRFAGGTFDDGTGRQLAASHSPNVKEGDEVVAIITEHDNHPCTLTQCSRGLFQIKDGKVFAENESIVSVNNDFQVKFISKRYHERGQHKSLIAAGSVENFKKHLAKLAKTSSAKSQKRRVKIAKFDKGSFVASPALTKGVAAPSTNEDRDKAEAKRKKARAEHLATLSPKNRWELEELEINEGNPVFKREYLGEDQQ